MFLKSRERERDRERERYGKEENLHFPLA
jgi:hypothetical protein